MAAILNYTTTEAVRGALGVTDNELLDQFLIDQKLDEALLTDLTIWLPNHSTIWAESQDVAATEEQKQKGRLLSLYSMWFCASLASEMWMAYPQRLSDGKEDLRRFTELDLKKLSEMAASKRDMYRDQLIEAENPGAESSVWLVGGARPAYDPVTGQ